MKEFIVVVKFVDIREITIEAETLDEAAEKYRVGDWASEDTINFYSDEELSPLHERDQ